MAAASSYVGRRPRTLALATAPLTMMVTVMVRKERHAFVVDQLVLDSYLFHVLLVLVIMAMEECRGRTIFVDVDVILFECILWLACEAVTAGPSRSSCNSTCRRSLTSTLGRVILVLPVGSANDCT
uniref:Uncharacterized protein n=1 Tax=Arundo donax TaxID=35708 RepID=A0A0A9CGM4_ARUDO